MDAVTRLAARFRRGLRQAHSPIEKQACQLGMPTMAAAHTLRFCEPELRMAVEARLLAEELIGTVAVFASLDVRVVELYAALFYDISDRLTCPDFIRTRVIQADEACHDPALARSRAVRTLCWLFGPGAADFLFTPAAHPEPGGDHPSGLMAVAERLRVRNLAYRNAILALAGRPFDERAGQKLTDVLTAIELADAQKPGATPDAGLEALKQIVDVLSKAALSTNEAMPDYVRPHAASPVEPNAAELLRLQRGLPVPELDAKNRWANERVSHVEPAPGPDAAPVG